VCAITVDGRQLLASAGNDQAVRLWYPASGAQIRALYGHTDWVNAVCAITVDGRQLLASAGNDQAVRLWDPTSGDLQYSVHVRAFVRSLIALGTGTLIAALRNGLLALSLEQRQ
jgi:WD40 repeat protein